MHGSPMPLRNDGFPKYLKCFGGPCDGRTTHCPSSMTVLEANRLNGMFRMDSVPGGRAAIPKLFMSKLKEGFYVPYPLPVPTELRWVHNPNGPASRVPAYHVEVEHDLAVLDRQVLTLAESRAESDVDDVFEGPQMYAPPAPDPDVTLHPKDGLPCSPREHEFATMTDAEFIHAVEEDSKDNLFFSFHQYTYDRLRLVWAHTRDYQKKMRIRFLIWMSGEDGDQDWDTYILRCASGKDDVDEGDEWKNAG
jgi:hypothetical protein